VDFKKYYCHTALDAVSPEIALLSPKEIPHQVRYDRRKRRKFFEKYENNIPLAPLKRGN